MTDEELAAIKERAEAATAGPWLASTDGLHEIYGVDAIGERIIVCESPGVDDYGGLQLEEDADFIAHAREDIPALLAEVEAWRAIGRVVATEDVGMSDGGGGSNCAYCSAADYEAHRPDCAVTQSRTLLGLSE